MNIINTTPAGKPFPQGCLTFMNATICYPVLFTPKMQGPKGKEKGDPKYSATFILPPLTAEENALLTATYNAVVAAGFPQGMPPGAKTPWKNAIDFDKSAAGRMAIGANCTEASPPRVSTVAGPLTIHEQSQMFSGVLVGAHLKLYAYNQGGGSCGVTAIINSVRIIDNVNVKRLDGRLDDDDAFGGGVPTGAPAATAPVPDQPMPAVAPSQQVQPGMVAPGAPAAAAPGPMGPGDYNPLS